MKMEQIVKKRKIFTIIVIVISALLGTLGMLLLPPRVTVNLSFSGESSYMSKYVALVVPFAISVFSALMYKGYEGIFQKKIENDDWKSGIKYLLFSIVGIVLALWVIFKNI